MLVRVCRVVALSRNPLQEIAAATTLLKIKQLKAGVYTGTYLFENVSPPSGGVWYQPMLLLGARGAQGFKKNGRRSGRGRCRER
jgi:hypothetical protein